MQHSHALHGFTVLVVDDNLSVLKATTYLLEAAFGCQVLTAASCVEALTLMEKGTHVDLIFSDVVLTGADGLTLARTARERMPELPVVLTAWEDQIESIIACGYMALAKAYSVKELESMFTELLCKPAAAVSAVPPADDESLSRSFHGSMQTGEGTRPV